MSLHSVFIRLHRWVGLAIAIFLVIAGLTGSVIAFNHDLDEWLNPDLFKTSSAGPLQSTVDLAARLEKEEPRFRVTYVPLVVESGHAVVFGLAGRDDARSLEVFVDPVTGQRLGQREWGACCVERQHLLPWIYKLHYSLHLPESWGLWAMGLVGLAWAGDCFVGFYLTLPSRRRGRSADAIASSAAAPRESFWQRWKPAWRVMWNARAYRVNFDLHRAAGLWFWSLLFTLAVSGVYLALPFEIVRPALSVVTTLSPSPWDPAAAKAAVAPRVSFATVVATAEREATSRGWAPPFDIFHSPEYDVFGVGFGDHHAPGIGVPYLYFNAQTGAIVRQIVPGEGRAGDVFLQWMFPLHSGQVAGLAGRIVIAVTGVAVAVLSVTGVVIWAKKRSGRRAMAVRHGRMQAV